MKWRKKLARGAVSSLPILSWWVPCELRFFCFLEEPTSVCGRSPFSRVGKSRKRLNTPCFSKFYSKGTWKRNYESEDWKIWVQIFYHGETSCRLYNAHLILQLLILFHSQNPSHLNTRMIHSPTPPPKPCQLAFYHVSDRNNPNSYYHLFILLEFWAYGTLMQSYT